MKNVSSVNPTTLPTHSTSNLLSCTSILMCDIFYILQPSLPFESCSSLAQAQIPISACALLFTWALRPQMLLEQLWWEETVSSICWFVRRSEPRTLFVSFALAALVCDFRGYHFEAPSTSFLFLVKDKNQSRNLDHMILVLHQVNYFAFVSPWQAHHLFCT